MSHLLDDDDDLHGPTGHREFTLSTGTVLALFLGLALSWALFFGFGYSIGSKSKQAGAPTVDTTAAAEPDTSGNFKNFKPSPGSPAGGAPTTVQPATSPAVPTTPVAAANTTGNTTPPDATATPEKPAGPAPIHLAPPPPAAAALPGQAGTFVVQIAAFTHPEDARMFINSLHAKGYNATAQTGADNLTHVQIGPYNNRKEADSMKQQLSADGYNAMIK